MDTAELAEATVGVLVAVIAYTARTSGAGGTAARVRAVGTQTGREKAHLSIAAFPDAAVVTPQMFGSLNYFR